MDTDKKNILIVEDDPFLADMYKTRFEASGYGVTVAEDGEQCLHLLESGLRPTITLLDVVMPKMDGIELLTTIKSNDKFKDLPIILLTNLGQESDITKGMEMGALDYLVKAHFTPSEVVKKVEELINSKSA